MLNGLGKRTLAIHNILEITAACQKQEKFDSKRIAKHISWFSFSKLVRLF